MILKSVTLVISFAAIFLGTTNALSCYSCSGSDCLNSAVIGQLTDCNGVSEKCFTRFNGYVPTQRGCVSSLSPAEQSLCPGTNCEVCSEDYCNLKSLSTHKCTVCSSVLDEKCVSDPASLSAVQCGAVTLDVTENQCYSRVIGSVTERGCVQSQADLDMCDGSLCETCSGENCNTDEYPIDRQKCVKCSGALCSAATETGFCDNPSESCVSIRRSDGTLTKNCESSLADTDRSFCQTNPASCSRCSSYECNKGTVDFSASRRCYKCQGSDCLRSSVEIVTCDNVDDVCFSLFDGFNPVRRGCKSTLSTQEKDTCDDANDVSCDLCSTDACNLNSREDHQCNYCSSVTNSQCIASPNNVVRCPAPTTEVSEEAQCYTRIIGMATERGCLGTPAADLECTSSKNCQMCAVGEGEACNTGIFPQDRIKCVVNTAPNQYCADPWDSCAQIMLGTARSKKCRSSMSADEVAFCQANSNKCDFCTGDNCNAQDKSFNYLDCVACSSSTDYRCIGNALAVTSVEHCTTCVAIYTGSPATVRRGCLSSLSAQEQQQCSAQSMTCTTCTTNRCNTAVYPTDRLSCYSCLKESCFSHDSIKLEYCPIYQQGDSCIVQLDSLGKLVRMGCKSSLSSSQVSACNANSVLCKTCTRAGCNKPSTFVPRSSCVQCNTLNDPDCIGKSSDLYAEPCNDPTNNQCYSRLLTSTVTERGCVSDLDSTERLSCYTCLEEFCFSHDSIKLEYCPIYQQGDSCIVQLDSSGKLVRMGCKSSLSSSQLSACNANSDLCKTCTKSGCNKPSAVLPRSSCVQCSSAHDPDCIGKASKFDGEPCNDPTNTQCYSRLLSNAVTERGCVSELDSTAKAQCVRGADCSLCSSSTGKCNSLEYPMGWRRCFQCDSAQDSSCKNAQSGTAPYCGTYSNDNQCFTIVQKDGRTIRKCATTGRSECSGSAQCELCQFSGCNYRVSTDITGTDTSTVQPQTTPKPSPASRPIGAGSLIAILLMLTVALSIRRSTHV